MKRIIILYHHFRKNILAAKHLTPPVTIRQETYGKYSSLLVVTERTNSHRGDCIIYGFVDDGRCFPLLIPEFWNSPPESSFSLLYRMLLLELISKNPISLEVIVIRLVSSEIPTECLFSKFLRRCDYYTEAGETFQIWIELVFVYS